jgi:hypothetical protein
MTDERSASERFGRSSSLFEVFECSAESYDRLDTLRFVNPLVMDDSVRVVLDSARRLLEFERFLDRVELIKGEQGTLPAVVEERVADAMERAQLDARAMASAAVDAISEYESVRAFDQIVPNLANCLNGKEIEADRLMSEALPLIEEFAVDQGLPQDLWRWAIEKVDFGGVTISSEDERTLGSRGDRRAVLNARNPTPLPLLDGRAFVDGRLYRRGGEDPNAVIDGVPHISPYGSLLKLVKTLLERYEQRSQTTRLHGVQVLPTGFDPITIGLIILIVVSVVSLVITILCFAGVFDPKSGLCVIAGLVLLAALLIWCIIGGTVSPGGDGDVGVMCTFVLDGEPPVG